MAVKTNKSKKSDPRCYARAWELIYDQLEDIPGMIKHLCVKKYGVLWAFARSHLKDGKSHTHVGVILRQEKITDFMWKDVKAYFTLPCGKAPRVREKLKCNKPSMHAKLMMYYKYCGDTNKHPGEKLGVAVLHKWKPTDPEKETVKPKPPTARQMIEKAIFEPLFTIAHLDKRIEGGIGKDEWPLFQRAYALRNYDQFTKMIETLSEIRERSDLAREYGEKSVLYRPFQKSLVAIMDEQGDRGIHCHADPGNTGKNHFVKTEGMRPDTLILQNAETKRIAYLWDPRKHKRIIFDIPKHKMKHLNTSVIEKLKNGTLLSTMHHPKMKVSQTNPKILILGNEEITMGVWTSDRVSNSTTSEETLTLEMV